MMRVLYSFTIYIVIGRAGTFTARCHLGLAHINIHDCYIPTLKNFNLYDAGNFCYCLASTHFMSKDEGMQCKGWDNASACGVGSFSHFYLHLIF